MSQADGRASVLRLAGVKLGYGRRTVLRDVELDVPRGSFLGIIGPNGGGKTTLLRCLLGLLKPQAGHVHFPEGRPRFGYVQQRQHVDEIFPLRAEEIVLMGRAGRFGPLRLPGRVDEMMAHRALATVGLEGERRRLYRELSGGQRQRCLIARALASEPDVLVLDEPTNDMDVAGETMLLELVQRVRRESELTVLLVSHLLHVVLSHADHLALVGRGGLTSGPFASLATAEGLSRFYGIELEVLERGGRRVVVPCASRSGHE